MKQELGKIYTFSILEMFEEYNASCQPYVSLDPLRDPNSFTFKIKVRELGNPLLPLYDPNVRTEEATFGMA